MHGTIAIRSSTGLRRFAKVSRTAAEARRVEREAAVLRELRHPGVVRLVTADTAARPYVLLTEPVTGWSLAEAAPVPGCERARILAQVAAILADLHDRGWVHGWLTPDHILVEADGHPVLCGFGYGGRAGEAPAAVPPEDDPFRDPARAAGSPLDPSADVYALARLAEGVGDPGLRPLLDRAVGADPAGRPEMRELASALRHVAHGVSRPWFRTAAPSASSPAAAPAEPLPQRGARAPWERDASPAAGEPDRKRRGGPAPAGPLPFGGGPRRTALAALTALLGAGAVAGWLLLGGLSERPSPGPSPIRDFPGSAPTPPGPARISPEGPTSIQPEATESRASLPGSRPPGSTRPGCPAVDTFLKADVDGDGCHEAIRFEAGILSAGDARWAVGRPGDLVAVGAWGCQPVASLALVRPSSGDVYLFRTWAAPAEEVAAERVGRVAQPQAVRAEDRTGDGCADIVVERAAGDAAVISPPRP